jgi:hypothetical protein
MSKLAHSSGHYDSAAYHLQQSVEKAAKALFLWMGVLDLKTIRGTGHDAPKLFLKMAKLPWAKMFIERLASVPGCDMTTDTSTAEDVIDKKKVDMARIGEQQVITILGLSTQMDNAMQQFSNTLATELTNFVSVFIRLYLLTCITFPHEEFTRYHDKEIKPKDYDTNLGIVKVMPELWNATESTIDGAQQLVVQRGSETKPKTE